MTDDKVQRYDFEDAMNCACGMAVEPTGIYVLHSAYAKLETELRDTKRALEMIEQETSVNTELFMKAARLAAWGNSDE